jgi:uncharacterized membrane protein
MSATSAPRFAAAPAPRWLVFGSLALNLFFIGIAAALLIRGPAPPSDRSIGARIERLAETLPPADGDRLRAEFHAAQPAVDRARTGYEQARDGIRTILRREPFDAAALQDAMGRTRTARQDFDVVLQGVIAKAAAAMSSDGRQKLAEWPPGRPRR